MTMRYSKAQLPATSLVLLVVVLSACTAAGTGAAQSDPLVSAYPSASSTSPDCYGINESVDTPPLTIANLMPATTAVVVAQVKAIEGGVFNTKDGKKPVRDQRSRPNFNPGVVTPINLQVTKTIFGDAGPGALRVIKPGGTADCVVHTVSSTPQTDKGTTYVFFLQPSPDADGVRHPELPLVLVAWPVNVDGSVETAYDGTMSVEELAAAVANPTPPSLPPEPTPAGTANPG